MSIPENVTLRTERLILRPWNASTVLTRPWGRPEATSPLLRHVLYGITRDAFRASNPASSAFDTVPRST